MELKACCKERFEPVVQAIRKLQKEKEGLDEPLIVAIDGRCGSGKTTLGEYLEQVFNCNLFRMDDFFLRMEQRTPQRLKETGGNVDYERFAREVLAPLKAGQGFSYRPYHCKTGTLGEAVVVEPKPINIVEGTYSQHPYFGDAYDLRLVLTVSETVRTQRILARPAHLHRRFFEEWIPKEQAYFAAFAIAEHCDLLVECIL